MGQSTVGSISAADAAAESGRAVVQGASLELSRGRLSPASPQNPQELHHNGHARPTKAAGQGGDRAMSLDQPLSQPASSSQQLPSELPVQENQLRTESGEFPTLAHCRASSGPVSPFWQHPFERAEAGPPNPQPQGHYGPLRRTRLSRSCGPFARESGTATTSAQGSLPTEQSNSYGQPLRAAAHSLGLASLKGKLQQAGESELLKSVLGRSGDWLQWGFPSTPMKGPRIRQSPSPGADHVGS